MHRREFGGLRENMRHFAVIRPSAASRPQPNIRDWSWPRAFSGQLSAFRFLENFFAERKEVTEKESIRHPAKPRALLEGDASMATTSCRTASAS